MLFTRIMRLLAPSGATVAALMVWTGCGGDFSAPRAPARTAPAYTEHDAQLFDDGVEGRALGYEISNAAGKDDRLLADRVEACDGVVRARVVTVTSKTEDSGTALQMSLRAIEALAGRHAPTGDFTLVASAKSSAFGLLSAAESHLVGTTFVVFVRGFASEGAEGDGVLHFHLASDDKGEQDRVRAASVGGLH